MKKMTRSRSISSALVSAIFCVGLLQASHATEISSQTLRYSVKYTKHDAGELEVIIDKQGDVIKTSAISHLSTLAKMFLSGQTIETWFLLNGKSGEVTKGNILGHKSDTITSSFQIDKEAGVIRYKNRDDEPIVGGDYFESTSFPIVLMASDINTIEGTTIREVNPKKSRYYVYQKPVSDNVELKGKSYDTWKVVRNKRGDPDRTVTFWLDKTSHVPLKIISSKKSKDTVMTLLNPS